MFTPRVHLSSFHTSQEKAWREATEKARREAEEKARREAGARLRDLQAAAQVNIPALERAITAARAAGVESGAVRAAEQELVGAKERRETAAAALRNAAAAQLSAIDASELKHKIVTAQSAGVAETLIAPASEKMRLTEGTEPQLLHILDELKLERLVPKLLSRSLGTCAALAELPAAALPEALGVELAAAQALHAAAALDVQLRHHAHAACIVGYDDSAGFTTYLIRSAMTESDGGCSRFSAQHRFREFLALHEEIQPQLSLLPARFSVPKRWFHPRSVKEKRVVQLQQYLVDALGTSSAPPVAALAAFLGRTEEARRGQGEERRSAAARLQECTSPARPLAQMDLVALNKAIQTARSSGVVAATVGEAERKLARVKATRESAAAALQAAQSRPAATMDLDRLAAAVPGARDAGVAASVIQAAEQQLQRVRTRREAAAQQLQLLLLSMLVQVDVAALDVAIATAREAGVDRGVVQAAEQKSGEATRAQAEARRQAAEVRMRELQAGSAVRRDVNALQSAIAAARSICSSDVVRAAERALEEAARAQIEPQLLRNLESTSLERHTTTLAVRGLGTCAAVVELSVAALSAALGLDAVTGRELHEAAAILPAELEEAKWQNQREQIAARLQEMSSQLAARDEELRGQRASLEALTAQQRAAAGREQYEEATRLRDEKAKISQQVAQAESTRSELARRRADIERELRKWEVEEARRVRDRERATQADRLQAAVVAAEQARHPDVAALRAVVAAARAADVDGGLVQAAERVVAGIAERQRVHAERRARPSSELHRTLLRIADELDGLYQLKGRSGASRFLVEPRQLVFGQPVEAARGVEHYMNVDKNDIRRGMIDGVAAIRREVARLPDGKQDGYWNAGSVAKECLQYVLEKEAGSSDLTFQGGQKRDCDLAGNPFTSRRCPDGRGMRLADFLALPVSRDCDLEEAEVAGIRLYSTAAYEFINNPLRDQIRRRRGEPHPLPITVAFVREGLRKLRAVAAQSDQANAQVDLYRGMKDVAVPAEFLTKGGTELAPMSTTSNLKVAIEYSASPNAVLLRLRTKSFMTRGPDISFLSAFPGATPLGPPLLSFRV